MKEIMLTPTNHVFSRRSAQEILGVPIKKLEVYANCIRVEPEGRRPTMISKKKFVQEFVEKRKRSAQNLKVQPDPLTGNFVVSNPEKGSSYSVRIVNTEVQCTCEDYLNQLVLNPITLNTHHAICKHGYAVLKCLGYSSLKEFIQETTM